MGPTYHSLRKFLSFLSLLIPNLIDILQSFPKGCFDRLWEHLWCCYYHSEQLPLGIPKWEGLERWLKSFGRKKWEDFEREKNVDLERMGNMQKDQKKEWNKWWKDLEKKKREDLKREQRIYLSQLGYEIH